MTTQELTTIPEILSQIEMIQFLYPNMTLEKYKSYISEMQPHNYTQIAVFDGDKCVGLTGLWTGTKLWTGKYLEMDNFVVHPEYRKRGIGKIISEFINQKAKDLGCTCIVLDAFTANFGAHKFYYNLGYEPRGFHFIKTINENGFS
jgi:GNAT superfamily N-acetyltransferase